MTRFYYYLLCFILLASSATAQTKEPPPAPRQPAPANDAAGKAEADRVAKQRRAQARSLLLSLAGDARSFRDQTLRARTLAQIADSLWDTDIERGRELFRKAWEAAEKADEEIARKRQEDIQRQQSGTNGGYAIPAYPSVRGELLRLAGRRDRELGEEFLQSLKTDQQLDVNGQNQRLTLASELLGTGDSERAMQFAASELANINLWTVDFLTKLREKDSAAADERYRTMIAMAARNPLADANTVSLLSSYLFTPHRYVTFQGSGTSYSMMGSAPPAEVAPALRSRFFQMASSVLLRAEPQTQTDPQRSGMDEQYLTLKLLLPTFEQYAPREVTESIRARFEALGAMVRESVRQRRTGPREEKPSETENVDREQSFLDRVERAKTSAERDQLYFQLAQEAMRKDDLSPRDFVSKIEDSEFRKQVQAYIDITLATNLVRKKKFELALELSHKGELTHIQRVWLLTRVAKLLPPSDREKALSLLEEAVTEARRIPGSDGDRPRALFAIANALERLERTRTWDSVFEAVKAANSAEGFTGEDGNLNILFQAKGYSSASDLPEADFDVKGIFNLLANDNYDRAAELASGFQGEAPRAAAVIAIAQALLKEKTPPVPKTPPVAK
jgi:hypothetical protein